MASLVGFGARAFGTIFFGFKNVGTFGLSPWALAFLYASKAFACFFALTFLSAKNFLIAAFLATALAFLAALKALALAINLSVFDAFFLSLAAIAFLFFSNAFYFLIFFKPFGTAFLAFGPNFFDFFNLLATPDFFFFAPSAWARFYG